MHHHSLFMRIAICWLACSSVSSLIADDAKFFPLDHRQPTGTAGRWSVIAAPQMHGHFQPVRVLLPTQGHVTYFKGTPQNQILTQSPSQVSMMVGHAYRIRISGMPEYPGVELYPTIEVLDRLHPPQDHINEFPIPIELTQEEIETAMNDQMVTKVIYLEQPDLATPYSHADRPLIEDLPVTANLMEAADHRGRPMAILRIGGRIPDPRAATDEFFSHSPILITTK